MSTYKNNYVKISGRILDEFEFDHNVRKNKFYSTKVVVRRKSGTEDIIPIIIPKELIKDNIKDTYVKIIGEYRSFNKIGDEGKSHLILFVFVKDIKYDECCEDDYDENYIYLKGYIGKPIKVRMTALGKIIADMHFAVNRNYCISDYIPCIGWGTVARYLNALEVGTKIEIVGRIQSRQYVKYYEDSTENKIAYEIAISTIK